MTVFQRISANISKQIKDSLFYQSGNQQLPSLSNELELNELAATDESVVLLSEAKAFIDKTEIKKNEATNKNDIGSEVRSLFLRFLIFGERRI